MNTKRIFQIALLAARGRLTFTMDAQDWIAKSEALPFLHFVPVDNAIAVRSVRLAEPFHNDPADRIIVATAITMGVLPVPPRVMLPMEMTVHGRSRVLRTPSLYNARRNPMPVRYSRDNTDNVAPRKRELFRPYIRSSRYDLARTEEPADCIDRLLRGA